MSEQFPRLKKRKTKAVTFVDTNQTQPDIPKPDIPQIVKAKKQAKKKTELTISDLSSLFSNETTTEQKQTQPLFTTIHNNESDLDADDEKEIPINIPSKPQLKPIETQNNISPLKLESEQINIPTQYKPPTQSYQSLYSSSSIPIYNTNQQQNTYENPYNYYPGLSLPIYFRSNN